jgi:hypothetical protein
MNELCFSRIKMNRWKERKVRKNNGDGEVGKLRVLKNDGAKGREPTTAEPDLIQEND